MGTAGSRTGSCSKWLCQLLPLPRPPLQRRQQAAQRALGGRLATQHAQLTPPTSDGRVLPLVLAPLPWTHSRASHARASSPTGGLPCLAWPDSRRCAATTGHPHYLIVPSQPHCSWLYTATRAIPETFCRRPAPRPSPFSILHRRAPPRPNRAIERLKIESHRSVLIQIQLSAYFANPTVQGQAD